MNPHPLNEEKESMERAEVDKLVRETVAHNRIELAKDIKHRHWVNDGFRDAYLDAVIEIAQEQLDHIKNGDWEVTNSNTGETHWEKAPDNSHE